MKPYRCGGSIFVLSRRRTADRSSALTITRCRAWVAIRAVQINSSLSRSLCAVSNSCLSVDGLTSHAFAHAHASLSLLSHTTPIRSGFIPTFLVFLIRICIAFLAFSFFSFFFLCCSDFPWLADYAQSVSVRDELYTFPGPAVFSTSSFSFLSAFSHIVYYVTYCLCAVYLRLHSIHLFFFSLKMSIFLLSFLLYLFYLFLPLPICYSVGFSPFFPPIAYNVLARIQFINDEWWWLACIDWTHPAAVTTTPGVSKFYIRSVGKEIIDEIHIE